MNLNFIVIQAARVVTPEAEGVIIHFIVQIPAYAGLGISYPVT